MNGHAGPTLAYGREFNSIAMSQSGQYLTYVPEYGEQLNLTDLNTGLTISVYKGSTQWVISWAGWVK